MTELTHQPRVYPPVTGELLSKITSGVLSAGTPVKIVLFGSRARGNAKPDSDIDILIIEEHDVAQSERFGNAYRNVIAKLFPEVTVIVYGWRDVEEWRFVHNHLITDALENGKTLYEDSRRIERLAKDYALAWDSKQDIPLVCEHKTTEDLTKSWFRKADKNLKAAQILLLQDDFEDACFLIQQAIEKYLKGYLTYKELGFEKTHDLQYLYVKCKQFLDLPAVPPAELEPISKWTIDARYDFNFEAPIEQIERAVKIAEQFKSLIYADIPDAAKPA